MSKNDTQKRTAEISCAKRSWHCLSIKQFLTLGNDNVKQADLGENPGFMSVEFYAGMNLIRADRSQELSLEEEFQSG